MIVSIFFCLSVSILACSSLSLYVKCFTPMDSLFLFLENQDILINRYYLGIRRLKTPDSEPLLDFPGGLAVPALLLLGELMDLARYQHASNYETCVKLVSDIQT